jgi:hypothetical protein
LLNAYPAIVNLRFGIFQSTPLNLALQQENFDIANLLLNEGAEVSTSEMGEMNMIEAVILNIQELIDTKPRLKNFRTKKSLSELQSELKTAQEFKSRLNKRVKEQIHQQRILDLQTTHPEKLEPKYLKSFQRH